MNKIVIFAIGAIIGGAAGVFGGWTYAKTKYQKIADEEIESVKEHFTCPKRATTKSEEPEEASSTAEKAKNKPDPSKYTSSIKDQAEYKSKVAGLGYTNYCKPSPVSKIPDPAPSEDDEQGINERPYVVSPEEFDENEDYSTITLMYYADGMLTDDDNVPVEDPEEIIGNDYADHFGEFEQDAVYIRNDQLKCDYEILKDEREYANLQRYENPRRESRPHEIEE